MPVSNRNERRDWKAISWDYDWILSFSDDTECPYLLTEREIQALLTFLEPMAWKTRWESKLDTPIDQDVITALRDKIVDKLMRDEDCPSDPCEDGCIDYLPNSSFIRYEPNDPFRTPLLVPPGYTIIPWYTNPLIPLPGVIPTDAMVNQLSVAAPALPLSGFPRFSFEFDGRGEVEIELVNVPAGGFCLVVTDENVLNVKIVNTSSNILDILSLAGILAALGIDAEDANVVDTDVVEIDVPDVGHHRIDVTFLPNFGGETLLGFGGGLRRVTLCGPVQVVEEMYLQRQSPEDPCLIEQSTDGGITWQEAWRMDNCCDQPIYERYNEQGIKETSPDGETWTESRDTDPRFYPPTLPPLPGLPGEDLRCAAANNVTGFLHSAADDIIADAAIWSGVSYLLSALIGIILVVIIGATGGAATPLALGLVGALIATGSAGFAAAMTAGVYETFNCIVYCNTPDDGLYTEANWQAIKAGITSQLTGIASTFLHDNINMMGIAGLNNASRSNISEGLECDTCDCENEWCYLFDFVATEAQLGWVEWARATTGGGVSGSTWNGSGWDSETTGAAFPFNDDMLMSIKRSFTDSLVTSVTVNWHGGRAANFGRRVQVVKADNSIQEYNTNASTSTLTQVINQVVKEIRISIEQDGGGTTNPVITCDNVQFNGLGDNPIGVDNCIEE